jgi:dTMP kinase
MTMGEKTTIRASDRGKFITFEGGEGAGKSTQIKLLAKRLEAAGLRVVVTREPGGSAGAEIIRHLVLSGIGQLLGGAEAETLLFAAARDDHVETLIRPALARGDWVLCDRFSDSTRAYQGRVGSVSPGMLNAIERVTIGDLKPDLTLVLDIPVEIGMSRANARRGSAAPDRFEAETIDFHRRLRDAFRQIAAEEPARCALIDAVPGPNAVAQQVWTTVSQRLLPPVAEARIA